jgi:hypothetical protein
MQEERPSRGRAPDRGVVNEFVEHEIKPVVDEQEPVKTYPEALIERMKEIGFFGASISPE